MQVSLFYKNLYNYGFKAKQEPIYAITVDGKYDRFESRKDASEQLGVSGSDISHCLSGKLKKVKGYVFARAKELEKILPSGAVVVDNIKFLELQSHFCEPIIAIARDGSLCRFDSRKEAAETLKLDAPSISSCLTGKVNRVGNYTFVRAVDVEKHNIDGTISFNQDLIDEKAKVFRQRDIYAVDEHMNYQKFSSQKSASEQLDFDISTLKKLLSGESNSAQKYAFIRALDIEKSADDGEIVLDKAKLEELRNKFKKAIYAVDSNGNYQRFESRKEASETLGLDDSSITHCLNGKVRTVGNYTFVRAIDVEKINEDGSISIVIDNNLFKKTLSKALYAIAKDGSYTRFSSRKEAADTLKLDPPSITHCLNGRGKTVGGYIFVRASDVETIDENGNISVNI